MVCFEWVILPVAALVKACKEVAKGDNIVKGLNPGVTVDCEP